MFSLEDAIALQVRVVLPTVALLLKRSGGE